MYQIAYCIFFLALSTLFPPFHNMYCYTFDRSSLLKILYKFVDMLVLHLVSLLLLLPSMYMYVLWLRLPSALWTACCSHLGVSESWYYMHTAWCPQQFYSGGFQVYPTWLYTAPVLKWIVFWLNNGQAITVKEADKTALVLHGWPVGQTQGRRGVVCAQVESSPGASAIQRLPIIVVTQNTPIKGVAIASQEMSLREDSLDPMVGVCWLHWVGTDTHFKLVVYRLLLEGRKQKNKI